MSEDRDPELQKLFAEAQDDLPGEAFTAGVMASIRDDRRQAVRRKVVAAILAIPSLAVLVFFLQGPIYELTLAMSASLIEVESGMLGQILAPVNNVGFVAVVALLVLRFAYRKIFD